MRSRGIRQLAFLLSIGLAGALQPGCSCGGDNEGGQNDAAPQADASPQQDVLPPQQDAPQTDAQTDVAPADRPPDGYVPDGGWTVVIDEVVPSAVPRAETNSVDLHGHGFQSGATVRLINCADDTIVYEFPATVSGGDAVAGITIDPTDPPREQGLYSVMIINPDGSFAILECAFTISAQPRPTVTNVKPASAFKGDPADGINSNQLVDVIGTGFLSTPNVRWESVTTGTLYDLPAQVGFIDGTQLSAVCPSETKQMPVGDYYVWVINPDNLAAEWMVPDTANPGELHPGDSSRSATCRRPRSTASRRRASRRTPAPPRTSR